MIANLQEITFASANIEEMEAEALVIVEGILKRKLERADPLRLFIKSMIAIIAQQNLLIDHTAKQNLLAYSSKVNLDHIGVLVGCIRLQATAAMCKVEVKLSAAREKVTVIKGGTRITSGDKVYFELDRDVIFLAGETKKEGRARCTETGEIGNNYFAGEVNRIVDPQPYLLSIVNTTKTEGGADIETDEAFRQRIHEAPESFSNAGSYGAYEYFAKTASAQISDVKAVSGQPGCVDVYVLLKGGELPQKEILQLVYDTLSDKKRRPLTDFLTVKPAQIVNYDIDLRYLISREDITNAATIQEAAENAVKEYIEWQRGKLGRDINETELYYKMRQAGVKRVEINAPKFTPLSEVQVAIPSSVKVKYSGLEEE